MNKPDRRAVESTMRERLSSRLFDHSRQVADYAVHLAEKHGADPDWMYICGMYHDLGKTLDVEKMRETAVSQNIAFDEDESLSGSLMHSAASAAFFKNELNPPAEYVSAVRSHTVGAVPFCLEEKILYVADFAEPTRSYEECATVRKTAERDMDLAALEAVSFKIRFLILRNKRIHPRSVQLYNFLLAQSKKEK